MNLLLGRLVVWVVAAGVLAITVTAVRIVATSRAEFLAGEEALAQGDAQTATADFRRAIRWYLPLSPYPKRALDQLRAIAQQAESRGDDALAIEAWRAIHAGLSAARTLWLPHKSESDEADARIAQLMVRRQEVPTHRGSVEDQTAALQTDIEVHPVGLLMVLLGFSGWIVALVVLTERPETRLGLSAFQWRIVAFVAFAIFALGMWSA